MRHVKTLFAILLMTAAHTAYAADSICEPFAQKTMGQVIGIFHDTGKNVDQKRALLTTIFQSSVDTDWIGKYVLGKYWNDATEDEKQQYLAAYRIYITKTYIGKFDDDDGYHIATIDIESVAPAGTPNEYTAKTVIKSTAADDADMHVSYLLDQSAGTCVVHDINIEGVSLLLSQSSEFRALAGKAGVKGVIAALQKKGAAAATH